MLKATRCGPPAVDREHPSSLGQVCIKGATVGETLATGVACASPCTAADPEDDFEADQLGRRPRHNHRRRSRRAWRGRGNADGIAMYGSGQFHTEDYYLAQKLLKGALGTNNFDANSRLCMSSAVAGYTRSLGSDGPALLLRGSGSLLGGLSDRHQHRRMPSGAVPAAAEEETQKPNGSVKIVVVDPRRTDTAKAADIHLPIAPGSDLALLHGIAHLMLRDNGQDPAFIDDHTENFDAFFDVAARWTPAGGPQVLQHPRENGCARWPGSSTGATKGAEPCGRWG